MLTLPNLCAKEFGAVLDGSPMTNVDKGIVSWKQKTEAVSLLLKSDLHPNKIHICCDLYITNSQ